MTFTLPRGYAFFITFLMGMAFLVLGLLVFLLPEADQPALTAPLVITSVIFSLFWCVPVARDRANGKVDWFHPSILYLIVYFSYFIFSGILLWVFHGYNSIWVNLGHRPAFIVNTVFCLGLLATFSFGLGMRLKPLWPGRTILELFNHSSLLNWKRLRYLIFAFLVIGAAFKYYHLSLLGPLTVNILRYLSPSANRGLGISVSQFYIMLESMLDWAALLVVFYFIVRYKQTRRINGWWQILLLMIFVAFFSYIVSAKRSGILPLFLLPLIWYHYILKRLTIGRAGIYFLIGMSLVIGLLMARIVLPLLAQNLILTDYIGSNRSEIAAFYADSGEWATFDMITASVLHRDNLLAEIGNPIAGFFNYSFNTLIVFIPRAIWPDKPLYEDISHIYYRVFIDQYGSSGFSPTIWGTSFLFFHILGLVPGMFVLGWLLKSAYAIFQLQNGRPIGVFYYSIFYWMAFQFMRFGTTGFTLLFFLQSMAAGVLALFFVLRQKNVAYPTQQNRLN